MRFLSKFMLQQRVNLNQKDIKFTRSFEYALTLFPQLFKEIKGEIIDAVLVLVSEVFSFSFCHFLELRVKDSL